MTTPWPTVPLREIGTWYGGGTPSKSHPEFWEGGDIPWLSPKDMGEDVIQRTKDHITEAAVENSAVRLVPENSIAVVVRSGILERTLPIARVPFRSTLNQDMKAIHPHDGVDPRWLAYGLRAHEHQLLSTTRKAGTTVASIETTKLQAFSLPVPSVDEQLRIIELLEDHLSRLDTGAGLVTSVARRGKALELAALDALVPAGSPSVLMKDLARDAGYGTSTKCVPEGPGVPVARIPNIVGGAIDMADEKRAADPSVDLSGLMLEEGDVVFVRTNGSRDLIGRTAVVQRDVLASFASYLIRYKVDQAIVDPIWCHLMMNRATARVEIERLASSSAGQYNLSLGKIGDLSVPLPELSVQRMLIEQYRASLDGPRRLVSAAVRAQRRSVVLRRALLTAAFAGTLTGSRSDIERVEEMAGV